MAKRSAANTVSQTLCPALRIFVNRTRPPAARIFSTAACVSTNGTNRSCSPATIQSGTFSDAAATASASTPIANDPDEETAALHRSGSPFANWPSTPYPPMLHPARTRWFWSIESIPSASSRIFRARAPSG